MALAHEIEIHQVDGSPRREEIEQDIQQIAEAADELLGRLERNPGRGGGDQRKAEQAFAYGGLQGTEGVGDAEQR